MKQDGKPTKTIDYSAYIDAAMRGVVRRVLEQVAGEGLPGEHHCYISFDTTHPAVRISPQMRERYPREMTVVLQHQFWDLKVGRDGFSVMLSFANIPERLDIPFAAMTAFADPSIKFGLQFHAATDDDGSLPPDTSFDDAHPRADNGAPDKGGAGADVISLEAFRKK